MKKAKRSLTISLTLIVLGIFLLNKQLLAECNSAVHADMIIAPSLTTEEQEHQSIVAWTHSGKVALLDENLCLIWKIEIPQVSISDIKQHLGGLYVLSTKISKTNEIESLIIQYDIANGKEKQRWIDSKYYIWSLSSNKDRIFAISSNGNLLGLGLQGFTQIANYPRRSHYIPVGNSEPIVCTSPNLTKRNWKRASCYREGKFNWRKDGDWININPPFLCHN